MSPTGDFFSLFEENISREEFKIKIQNFLEFRISNSTDGKI